MFTVMAMSDLPSVTDGSFQNLGTTNQKVSYRLYDAVDEARSAKVNATGIWSALYRAPMPEFHMNSFKDAK